MGSRKKRFNPRDAIKEDSRAQLSNSPKNNQSRQDRLRWEMCGREIWKRKENGRDII